LFRNESEKQIRIGKFATQTLNEKRSTICAKFFIFTPKNNLVYIHFAGKCVYNYY
jgi:hypothetical protein